MALSLSLSPSLPPYLLGMALVLIIIRNNVARENVCRDIRKALAALARELNASEGKRMEIEQAFFSAGGGAGIQEASIFFCRSVGRSVGRSVTINSTLVLRGAILNRIYGTHKNLPGMCLRLPIFTNNHIWTS